MDTDSHQDGLNDQEHNKDGSRSKQEGSNNEEDNEDISRSKHEGSNNEDDNEDISSASLTKSNPIPGNEDNDSRSTAECAKWKDMLAGKDQEIKRLKEESGEKDTEIGRSTAECAKWKDMLAGKDQEIKRLKEESGEKDTEIGSLQQELQVQKCSSESFIKEFQRLKDFETKASALERVNIRLSETNRVLEIAVEENKEREKTIKEDAKQMLKRTETEWKKKLQGKEDELKRTETRWKKKLQGKEDELKSLRENYKTEKIELLNTWELHVKRLQTDLVKKDNALKQIQRELDLKDGALKGLQHYVENVQKERDDYQVRLSALMSTKLTTNNPEITDLSDINRPTKLAEKWGELYDNEHTELFETLQCVDEKKISLILKLLKRSFEICQEIREQGVVCLSYFSENNTMHNPLIKMEEEGDKEPRSNEEPADHEDPESASSKGDKNEETKDSRSNREPGDNGGQDSASSLGDKNEGGESQVNPDPKYGIDDTKGGESQVDPDTESEIDTKEGDKKPRHNEEPVDHGDPESASSKGDKNTDEERNDQADSQQLSSSLKQSAVKIDDNQKQTMDKCSQTATTEVVKLDVPDELKRELMVALSPYLKKKALEIVDILNKELPERVAKEFDMAWKTGNALDVYLKSCIRLCWLMGIQSPPVYIRFDEHDQASRHVKLDKNFYREYTKAGQHIDYVVWPPLQLYKEGPLLRRGVAQGTDSKD